MKYSCEGIKVEGRQVITTTGYEGKISIKNEMCDKARKAPLLIRDSCGVG